MPFIEGQNNNQVDIFVGKGNKKGNKDLNFNKNLFIL